MAWKKLFKRGADPVLSEIENSTFETIATETDKKLVEDMTFSPDLTAQTFTGQTKNISSFSSGQTKNTSTFTATNKS